MIYFGAEESIHIDMPLNLMHQALVKKTVKLR